MVSLFAPGGKFIMQTGIHQKKTKTGHGSHEISQDIRADNTIHKMQRKRKGTVIVECLKMHHLVVVLAGIAIAAGTKLNGVIDM